MNITKPFYFIVILASVNISVSHLSAQQDPLLIEVTKGFHQSLESIKTIRADFVSKQSIPGSSSTTIEKGHYLRSGQIERINQVNSEGTKRDRLIQSGLAKTLILPKTTDKHQRNRASISSFQNSYDRSSVLVELLIQHTDSIGKVCHLNDIIELNRNSITTERCQYQGKDCVKLTYTDQTTKQNSQKVSFWHDINSGYWIIRCEVFVNSRILLEATILDFYNISPNLHFPKSSNWKLYNKNESLYYERSFELNNIKINTPITTNELKLPSPPTGTFLTDEIKGYQGVMNTSWQLIGNSEKTRPIVLPKQLAVESGSSFQLPTPSESLETGNLILYLSLGCGLLFGSILLILRRRVRTASAS